jgi:tRNA1Val (adenine37-N6)-methyltransferase
MKVGTDAVLFGAWVRVEEDSTVLDIGTGSGIIALMIAQRCSSSRIDGVEQDHESALQAQENVRCSPFSGRIRMFLSSLQEFHPDREYDLIVSNPPYFENSLLSHDERKNSARHNTELTFEEIFEFSDSHLKRDGKISLVERIIKSAEKSGFFLYSLCEVRSHLNKKPNRILVSFSRMKVGVKKTELCMFMNERIPTEEYRELTKEFYLNY